MRGAGVELQNNLPVMMDFEVNIQAGTLTDKLFMAEAPLPYLT